MKTILLVVVLCACSFGVLFGRIRNGYETELKGCTTSLRQLRLLLEDKNTLPAHRWRVKTEIENLTNYILYHQLTDEILRQLKIISPAIYNETDSLKDKRGRPTDVYVKLIPGEYTTIPLEAASFFDRSPDDEDANFSDYGEYSVAIEIRISENALLLLSHEFGHAKYVVPNLATYRKFYREHYCRPDGNTSYMGHSPCDESGKYADAFERRFREDKKIYLQGGGRKPESVNVMLARIRKSRDSEAPRFVPSLIAGNGRL